MHENAIVVYASKYGTTKQYAEWIAQDLNAEAMDAKAVTRDKLQKYDLVVYGGGLYAGGIAGVKLVTQPPCKNLIVFTVGLADPSATDYSAIIQKNFTPELARKTPIFHLRGGIDYKKLGPVHRIMMSMMKNMIRKKSESERDTEDKELLRTYGSAVNFTDRNTIEPLVAFAKNL